MGMHRKSAVAAGVALLFGVGTVGGLAAANGNRTNLRADLSGANEVPPADPDGNGRARVELKVEGETARSATRSGSTTREHRTVATSTSASAGGQRRDRRPAVRAGGRRRLTRERRAGVAAAGSRAASPPPRRCSNRSPPTPAATTSTCTTPASPPERSAGNWTSTLDGSRSWSCSAHRGSRTTDLIGRRGACRPRSPVRRAGPARRASAHRRAGRAATPECATAAPRTPGPPASRLARTPRRRGRRHRPGWRRAPGSGRRRQVRRCPTPSPASGRRRGGVRLQHPAAPTYR